MDTLDVPSMRLGDMVADRIAAAIVDGTLPAGSRVRDQELAEQLGVSRMPVREALQRMQRVGLIETSASRYTRVTEVTPELIAATRQFTGHYVTSLMRMALATTSPESRVNAVAEIDRIISGLKGGGSPSRAYRELMELFMEVADNAFIALVSTDLGLAIQRNLGTCDGEDGESARAIARLGDLRDAVLDGDVTAAAHAIELLFGVEGE